MPDRGTIHNVKGTIMNQRFIMFRRAGVFYYEDTTTGKQLSLRTKDQAEATTLLHAKNESVRQPVLNLQIARAYLAGLREQFVHIQEDYRKRRRAFDTLFKHCKYDTGGSFAYRWECVLDRLRRADPQNLGKLIRSHIGVKRQD